MMDSTDNKKNNEKNKTDDKSNLTQSGGIKDQNDKPESRFADKVGSAVQGDTKAAKDIYNQAKEVTGEAADKIYDSAAKKASSAIDEQKSNLASSLAGVADSIRQIGGNFRDEKQPYGIGKLASNYGDTLANKVERASSYLDEKDLSELMKDVETFAHRNPALFLGGAFALGIVAARFLKSGNRNQALMRRQRYERKGDYLPNEHEGVHLPKNLDELSKAAENKSASAASSKKGA